MYLTQQRDLEEVRILDYSDRFSFRKTYIFRTVRTMAKKNIYPCSPW